MRARSLVGSEETGEKRHQRPCLPSEPADRALLFGGMFALRQCDTKERGQHLFWCPFLPALFNLPFSFLPSKKGTAFLSSGVVISISHRTQCG